jgi:RNA polymerase sigma-70 factor (ECF subfamily)
MNIMRIDSIPMNTAKTLDKQKLVEIYEQYSPELFRYASRLLDDSDLAEECVSETFSRFLQSIRGGTLPENVRAYLYRAAHNWIIDRYRHQPLPELALDDELQANPEGNPAHEVTLEMERQQIRAAIMQLPADQRQVIVLRFMQDLSHNEVAAAIGKTIEATRALQHRAVSALRLMLAE